MSRQKKKKKKNPGVEVISGRASRKPGADSTEQSFRLLRKLCVYHPVDWESSWGSEGAGDFSREAGRPKRKETKADFMLSIRLTRPAHWLQRDWRRESFENESDFLFSRGSRGEFKRENFVRFQKSISRKRRKESGPTLDQIQIISDLYGRWVQFFFAS